MKDYEIDAEKIERLELAAEVYGYVFGATDSFDGALGRDLAYLLGAIAQGTRIDLTPRSLLCRILSRKFKPGNPGHPVWRHISIDGKRAGST